VLRTPSLALLASKRCTGRRSLRSLDGAAQGDARFARYQGAARAFPLVEGGVGPNTVREGGLAQLRPRLQPGAPAVSCACTPGRSLRSLRRRCAGFSACGRWRRSQHSPRRRTCSPVAHGFNRGLGCQPRFYTRTLASLATKALRGLFRLPKVASVPTQSAKADLLTRCPRFQPWDAPAPQLTPTTVRGAIFKADMPLRGSQRLLEPFWVGALPSIASRRDRPLETILRAKGRVRPSAPETLSEWFPSSAGN